MLNNSYFLGPCWLCDVRPAGAPGSSLELTGLPAYLWILVLHLLVNWRNYIFYSHTWSCGCIILSHCVSELLPCCWWFTLQNPNAKGARSETCRELPHPHLYTHTVYIGVAHVLVWVLGGLRASSQWNYTGRQSALLCDSARCDFEAHTFEWATNHTRPHKKHFMHCCSKKHRTKPHGTAAPYDLVQANAPCLGWER